MSDSQSTTPLVCSVCGERPAGERDSLSPYCGTCDPNGARFFYDVAKPAAEWLPDFFTPRPAFSDDPRDSAIVSRPSGSGAGFSQGLPPVDDGDASMASLLNQRREVNE